MPAGQPDSLYERLCIAREDLELTIRLGEHILRQRLYRSRLGNLTAGAFATTLILAYARTFTPNLDRNGRPDQKVNNLLRAQLSADDLRFTEKVIQRRNEGVAHSDARAFDLVVFETGPVVQMHSVLFGPPTEDETKRMLSIARNCLDVVMGEIRHLNPRRERD